MWRHLESEKNGKTRTKSGGMIATRLEKEHSEVDKRICPEDHSLLSHHSYFAFPAWVTEDLKESWLLSNCLMDICWVCWKSVVCSLFGNKAKICKHILFVWEHFIRSLAVWRWPVNRMNCEVLLWPFHSRLQYSPVCIVCVVTHCFSARYGHVYCTACCSVLNKEGITGNWLARGLLFWSHWILHNL